jgi:DNA gyrase subunit A
MVNPDALARKIAELAKDGKLSGIADVARRDLRAHRAAAGHRAQARRGRQGRAEQPLQAHPAAGRRSAPTCWPSSTACPARCRLDAVRPVLDRAPDRGHRPAHRSTAAQGRGADAHPARLLKALDALDEVIALIRALGQRRGARRTGLMELLDIDELQATGHPRHAAAPPGRPGAAEDHRRARRARAPIADYEDILATPGRQRAIVSEELAEIVDKYGDDRRSQIVPFDGDMSMEDLIPRGGRGRHDHARGLRQAHPRSTAVPEPEARRQGACAARSCAATTSSSTSS